MDEQGISNSDQGTVRYTRVLIRSRVVALGASVTVGVGVYTLLGQIVRVSVGSSAILSYLIMFLIALPLIFTYAERAGVTPGQGGAYNLARSGGRLWLLFFTGWLLIGGYASLFALLAWGAAINIDIFSRLLLEQPLDLNLVASLMILFVGFNSLLGTGVNWRSRTGIIFGAIIVLALIAVRGLFFGEPAELPAPASRAPISILVASTLLVSSLWGIHYILDARDKIRLPTKNILPSMLIAVAIAAFLGAFAAFVVARYPGLLTIPNTPLANIPVDFGLINDAIAEFVYAGFGLIVTSIALHRGFVNGQRLFDVMARDGFFPSQIQRFSLRGAALLPLIIFGLLAILLINTSPILTIVALSSSFLLWTAALINLPDLIRPRLNLPEKRFPKLPFHPLFPGLVVAGSVILPATTNDIRLLTSLGWWVAGIVLYFFYSRRHSLATLRREFVFGVDWEGDTEREAGYKVMLGISNPESMQNLLGVATRLAKGHGGSVLVLRVLSLPEQMPARLQHETASQELAELEAQLDALAIDDVVVRPLVRLVPSVTEGLVGAINEEGPDLLVLGWDPKEPPLEPNSEPLLNAILRRAVCDVVLVRGTVTWPLTHVLIPTAGGTNAPAALSIAETLVEADQGRHSVVHMVKEKITPGLLSKTQVILESTLEKAEKRHRIVSRTIKVDSVRVGIVSEAEQVDLLMIGASKEGGISDRSYFGGLAAQVAYHASVPTMLVRTRETQRYPWLIQIWDALTDPIPNLTSERKAEVLEIMRDSAKPSVDFFVLIILASAIAVLGLLQNSAAVVIGAMLVAPLMSPILAMAMSMVSGNLIELRTATEATLKGILAAIFVGALVTMISPISAETPQLLARTNPNILDLMVALFSGAAAGYAISRKEVAAAMPGVAIAAALVPPLTTVGWGLATAQLDLATGALLLFTTNLIAIILAAALTFLALGFQPARASRRDLLRGMQITLVALLVVLVILGLHTFSAVRQIEREESVVELFTESGLFRPDQIRDLEINRHGDGFILKTTLLQYPNRELSPDELTQLGEDLSEAVGGDVIVDATIIDASRNAFVTESLAPIARLEQAWDQAMTDLSADVLDFHARKSGAGYALSSKVLAYERDKLSEESMDAVQEELSELVGAPISLRTSIITADLTELEPDLVETAEP